MRNQLVRGILRFVVLLAIAGTLAALIYFVAPAIMLPALRKFIPIP